MKTLQLLTTAIVMLALATVAPAVPFAQAPQVPVVPDTHWVWEYIYTGSPGNLDRATDIDASGGLGFAGQVGDGSAGDEDLFVARLYSNPHSPQQYWTHVEEGHSQTIYTDIFMFNLNAVLTGYRRPSQGQNQRFFVRRVDDSGVRWTWLSPSSDSSGVVEFSGGVAMADGGASVLACGNVEFANSQWAAVAKIHYLDGTTAWEELQYKGKFEEILLGTDGYVYTAGYRTVQSGGYWVYGFDVAKFDLSTGAQQWDRYWTVGADSEDYWNRVFGFVDCGDRVCLGGWVAEDAAHGYDQWYVMANSKTTGDSLWSVYHDQAGQDDMVTGLTTDVATIYACGFVSVLQTEYYPAIAKYSAANGQRMWGYYYPQWGGGSFEDIVFGPQGKVWAGGTAGGSALLLAVNPNNGHVYWNSVIQRSNAQISGVAYTPDWAASVFVCGRVANATQDLWAARWDPPDPVGLDDAAPSLPQSMILSAAPNPFNPTARLCFSLPEAGVAQLSAYDLLGRRVAVLHEGPLAAGEHEITWDATGLPSGVYLLRLTAGEAVATEKVVLLK